MRSGDAGSSNNTIVTDEGYLITITNKVYSEGNERKKWREIYTEWDKGRKGCGVGIECLRIGVPYKV